VNDSIVTIINPKYQDTLKLLKF